jgi:hypothetical protein
LAKGHTETHLLGDMDVRGLGKGATHTAPRLCRDHDHRYDHGLILGLVLLLDGAAVALRARDSAGGGAPATVATDTAAAVTGVEVQ